MTIYLMPVNLAMFGEGAAAAGAADAGTGQGNMGDTNSAVPGRTRRGKNTGETVLYGKQDTAVSAEPEAQAEPKDAASENTAAETAAKPTAEERRKAFREMIYGEYKDVYAEETQKLINRRFAESRNLEQQVQAQQPIIEMLTQRYNIADGDLDKLTKAIENDNAYWQQAAEEAGMDVDRYKEFKKLQRENEAMRAEQQNRQEREQAQKQAQAWFEQGEAMKAKYPGFDLTAELQNAGFVSMLRAGTPVEAAYKAMHFDELMDGAVQATAAETEKRVTDNIRARGARPAENGTSSRSGFTVKDDVSKLTKKDRAEIAKRALRGDTIKFN